MPLDIIQWIQQSSDPKCQWEISYVNENYTRTVFEMLMLPDMEKLLIMCWLINKGCKEKRGKQRCFYESSSQKWNLAQVSWVFITVFMKQAGSVCSYNLSHSVGISFLIFYQQAHKLFQRKRTFHCGWQGFTLALAFEIDSWNSTKFYPL